MEIKELFSLIKSQYFPHWLSIFSLLIILILGAGVIFFKDVAIDAYLLPHITKQLISNNYLSDDIKNGKFIVVEENSFNVNHKFDSSRTEDLKNDVFVKIAKQSIVNDKHKNNISELQQSHNKDIETLNKEIKQLAVKLSILEAKERGDIKIDIFHSNNKFEKGYLILNKSNPTISALINNNERYTIISSSGNKESFTSRIQDLYDGGKVTTNLVARLYVEDYHELFESEKNSGIGQARIRIK